MNKTIDSEKSIKNSQNTEGVTDNSFNVSNNEKNKKNKKKASTEHRVHANPPPKAHAQKPNGGGYA
jgi:hypothetical protein